MGYGMFGLIGVALAAYYIYYFKFGGKERAHQKFGLRPDEAAKAVYHAQYVLKQSVGKEIAMGLVGMSQRGMAMTVTFSDQGYLLLGNQENKSKPRRYQPHQVAVRDSSRKVSGRIAGPAGLEKLVSIVLLTPDAGEEHLALAASGVQALREFATGDQVQPSFNV